MLRDLSTFFTDAVALASHKFTALMHMWQEDGGDQAWSRPLMHAEIKWENLVGAVFASVSDAAYGSSDRWIHSMYVHILLSATCGRVCHLACVFVWCSCSVDALHKRLSVELHKTTFSWRHLSDMLHSASDEFNTNLWKHCKYDRLKPIVMSALQQLFPEVTMAELTDVMNTDAQHEQLPPVMSVVVHHMRVLGAISDDKAARDATTGTGLALISTLRSQFTARQLPIPAALSFAPLCASSAMPVPLNETTATGLLKRVRSGFYCDPAKDALSMAAAAADDAAEGKPATALARLFNLPHPVFAADKRTGATLFSIATDGVTCWRLVYFARVHTKAAKAGKAAAGTGKSARDDDKPSKDATAFRAATSGFFTEGVLAEWAKKEDITFRYDDEGRLTHVTVGGRTVVLGADPGTSKIHGRFKPLLALFAFRCARARACVHLLTFLFHADVFTALCYAGIAKCLTGTPGHAEGDNTAYISLEPAAVFSDPKSKVAGNFRRVRGGDPTTDKDVTINALRRGVLPPVVIDAQDVLSKNSFRTCASFAEFLARVRSTQLARGVVRGYFGSVAMRSRRFILSGRRKAAYASVLNKLLKAGGGKQVVLCVGDAFWTTKSRRGTKHASCVPALLRFLARHLRVVMVDEFRTSKMCACVGCDGEMAYDSVNRAGPCSECGHEKDRDENAASNMLAIAYSYMTTGERPEKLQRKEDAAEGAPCAVTLSGLCVCTAVAPPHPCAARRCTNRALSVPRVRPYTLYVVSCSPRALACFPVWSPPPDVYLPPAPPALLRHPACVLCAIPYPMLAARTAACSCFLCVVCAQTPG